jgi:hypothetical protein
MFLALLQVLALEGAVVHTQEPGAEPRVATVLVSEGRFLAVGDDLEVPEDAVRVDLSGKHLVPGLIDGMIHHDMEHDALYVLHGVTLARDLGNDLGRIFVNALPGSRDVTPGPSLQVAGAVFDGVPPATTEAVVVRDAAEVESKLPRLLELGAQVASFHVGIPGPAWAQLLASAEELGVDVWGPIPRGLDLERVLTSGQRGVSYLEGFEPQEGEERGAAARRLAGLYAQHGVASMPLQHVYGYRTEDPGDEPDIFQYLAPWYADWWRADLEGRRARFDEAYLEAGRAELRGKEALVRALHEAGVVLVPGSAAPNPWMRPGLGLHDELDAWVAAGIPAADALHAATAGAARALGVDEERGRIAAGLVADAVVCDGDPRQELGVLRQPAGVLLRGNWLDGRYLGQLRAALREAQEEATARRLAPIRIERPELPDGRVVLEGRAVTRTFDRVTAAEEYWVVRTYEGDTAYVARMVTPAGIGRGETVQTLVQRIDDAGRLTAFTFRTEGGGPSYRVEGQEVSGQFRIKRWVKDAYVDTNSSPSRPAVVDAGLVSAALVVGHVVEDGPLVALYFDGLDPALGAWECNRGSTGVLGIKTAEGPMVVTYEPNGAPDKIARSQGRSTLRVESEGSDAFGGPGVPPLPFPEAPEAEAGDDDRTGRVR